MRTIDERLGEIVNELISNGITLEQAEDAFERKLINVALEKTRGNVTQASKKLGVHRNTLHNKMRLIGVETRESMRRRRMRERRMRGRS